MKKSTLIILATIVSINVCSQYSETIRSERPGQALDPFSVGKGIFQLQSGVDFSSYELTDVPYTFSSIISGNVFRFGVLEKLEVGLESNWQNDKQTGQFGNANQSGISYLSTRIKGNVYEGEGLIPSVGAQFNLTYPFVSEAYKTDKVAPKFTLVTGQSLTEKLGLTTNLGIAWNGIDNNTTKFYVVNLGYALSSKVGVFVENYGFIVDGELDTKFDGGFDYLINNNLKLDLFAGYDKNEFSDEILISIGVSWRTNKK